MVKRSGVRYGKSSPRKFQGHDVIKVVEVKSRKGGRHGLMGKGGVQLNTEEDTAVNSRQLENDVSFNDNTDEVEQQTEEEESMSVTNSAEEGGEFDEGDRVRMERGVMNEFRVKIKHKTKQPHMNCQVETFGRVFDTFGKTKRKIIKDMGFDNLKHFIGKRLPNRLCYWLSSWVHVNRRLIRTVDHNFTLSANQVHWVLGTPIGGEKVPTVVEKGSSMKPEINTLLRMYGKKTRKVGNPEITMNKIEEVLKAECTTAEQKYEFRRAFLIYVLGMLFCPTTHSNFPADLLPTASVWRDCEKYNWSAFILEFLFRRVGKFLQSFDQHGFVRGGGGCTYFLAILYLDRLKRYPTEWGIFPRIKAWDIADITQAWKEDQATNGDFGNLGTLNVAYGDPRHPLEPRNTCGPQDVTSLANEVVKIIIPNIEQLLLRFYTKHNKDTHSVHESVSLDSRRVKKKRRGPTTSNNPAQWKKIKASRIANEQRTGAADKVGDAPTGDVGSSQPTECAGENESASHNGSQLQNNEIQVRPNAADDDARAMSSPSRTISNVIRDLNNRDGQGRE